MIQILLRHKDFIAVDKPEGLSAHNEPGADILSLVQRQLDLKELHLVHRLDKETSGVLLLTEKSQLVDLLQKAMQEKVYLCVGRKKWSGSESSGLWCWPLSDKAEGRINPQGPVALRKPCESQFEVIDSNAFMTAFRLKISSGRTHQIRKHTALAGHAILGDSRYNDPKYNRMISDRYQRSRMFLHASKLKLNWGGEVIDLTSPLPDDFKQLGLSVLSSAG